MGYTKLQVGPDHEGKYCDLKIHLLHKESLDTAIKRVRLKNWDYVAIIAGLPGAGKSTLARVCAKYCCPWFNLNYIAFTADEFVEISNNCEEYSSIILDESFQALNSRTTMSPDFLKIINHLQILRQKHLFIFLCLPNFFDLAKNIAIFRASHLFVAYPNNEGDRGPFLAFDRRTKTKLYVKGMRFMDYNAEKANYLGDFWENNGIVDLEKYEQMKKKHLLDQELEAEAKNKSGYDRNEVIYKLKEEFDLDLKELEYLFNLKERTLFDIIKDYRERRLKGAVRREKTAKSAFV